MHDKKILQFPPLIDKQWEETNRMLVEALENQGIPIDVSINIREWTKKIYAQHLKQLHIQIAINIPSAPPELQKKIEESIKESTELFIKEYSKKILSMFAVMIKTKIECEKARHELRLKSFLYD